MTTAVLQQHAEAEAHYAAGRFEAAEACYRAALAMAPGDAALHFNLGNVLLRRMQLTEALAAYDEAIALEPSFAIARHNRATCLLHLGDLGQGFREYEWRKACPGFVEDERYRLPRPWRGEELRGKTLYIYRELFQGDLIQFGRYARLAELAGARVILSAPPAMHALLGTMSDTLELVPDDAAPPAYDVQAALLTLPALFGTTLTSVPWGPFYLKPEPARVAHWRERIGSHGLKIGIAWQGSARLSYRAFPLRTAAEALRQVPGVRLISLQKHSGLEQLEALPAGVVESLGEDFDPGPHLFLDTAAAMSCCDLVVTLDTSVAHLAGALGVKTWLALAFAGDWRWLTGRTDSPWYPSVRIWRQPTEGDWASVFEAMRLELASASA